jgi:hypothetical protein
VSEVKSSSFCRTVCFQSFYFPSFLSTYINQKPDIRIIDFFFKSVPLTQKILHLLLRPVGSCRLEKFSNIIYYFTGRVMALLKPVSEHTASVIWRLLNDEYERIWKEAVVIYSKYFPVIFLGRMRNITTNLTQDVCCAEHRVRYF